MNRIKRSLYDSPPTIDREAIISFQYDKEDLAKAEGVMDNIINDINIEGYTSTDRVVANKVKELSSLLSSLVGYRVSLTYSAGSNFCTYIIPAKANDALLDKVGDVSAYYESTRSDGSMSDEYYKKSDTIDSMLAKSYRTLDEALNTKGIKVDLTKGKITGLDDSFTQIVMVDFAYVLDTFKLTARECLGCILHEIGHTFTYYMQLGNVSSNMNMLLDTIKDEYLVNNNSIRETITIAYSRISGDKKDTDSKSFDEVVVDLGRIILEPQVVTTNKEVESQSDLFATRYGYGADVATALMKMTNSRGRDKSVASNILALLICTLSIVIYVYLFIIGFILMSGVITYPIGYLLILLSTVLFDIVFNLDIATTSWGSPDSNRYDTSDYDSMYDRLSRIRQQMIASLKDSELDNASIKMIIGQLDALSKLTESKKNKKPIFVKIKSLLGNKRIRAIDTHYLLESLFNNDLMIARARLKTI